MQHVSFFRFKALPTKRQAVIDQMHEWEREQKYKAMGFIASTLVVSNHDADEFMGAVRWDTTENYFANANRPEQDAWYQQLRKNLVDDPTWFDGTVVVETMAEEAKIPAAPMS